MEIRLDDIAKLVGGVLHGDGKLICRGANPPGQSTDEQVTMLLQAQGLPEGETVDALAVIVPEHVPELAANQIVVSDPHAAFATVVSTFRPPVAASLPGVGVDSAATIANSAKVHPTATICSGVSIGARTIIMPGVVVMQGSTIGEDCVVYPGTTLYEYTRLGDRVIVHAGSTIGAHGFGYRPVQGRHEKLAQLGYVDVHSDVEIGAGVTIDRGAYGPTTIGEGTKIDNQVMIAHNCQIGKHNLICSQVGIAGSCKTGDYVILAGQVGMKDHVTLGDQVVVGAQAGVMDDLAPKQVYLGAPAIPQREQMQVFAIQRKLPDMRRELKALRRQLTTLTRQMEGSADADRDEEHRAA